MKKKIVLILIPTLLLIVSITLATIIYRKNHYPSISSYTANINLTSVYYAVQIGYNISYVLIGISILFVAYRQLNKTREATTISSLTSNAEKWNGSYMRQKRSELAELILANSVDKLNPLNNNKLTTWFENTPQKSKLSEKEIQEIAIVKNKFEVIAYEFEILGYYYKKEIYSTEDIYELFSYELQQYWLLFFKIGLIDWLKDKERGGDDELYDKFEKLFNSIISYEISNNSKIWLCNKKNKIELIEEKINSLKEEKINKMVFFLNEEILSI